ncbi:hypothetical protein FNV43_RR06378 [Rhamnella rubrinervis]|uniref:2-succinylbenzoate--CoA ligase, chloroplastic/peroxisomal n=1 Tax=Rhamnella rubrinervis TaxID=2594499 RepID=A0A8K0HEH5_9ROSA|nr:hypothetical protein FNV43_RR06378 [Rhamnella rubrinervis]
MGSYSDGHICQCLNRLSTLRHNSPLFISGDRERTGPEFVDSVLALAQGLLRLGLVSGDIVAIAAFNNEWYMEWLLAIAYVGGIAAPLNYRWCFEETMLTMDMVRPIMLVMDKSCNHWFSKLQNCDLPSLRWSVSLDSSSSNLISTWKLLTTEEIKKHFVRDLPLDYSWAPEGVVIICFTSGTTGRPKGVSISHSALIVQSLAKIAIVGYSEDDVYLHTAPLCHIGGLSSAIAMLMIGACHVLIPKFEANSALEAIEQYGVTSLITVPAMMADLIFTIRGKETRKGRDCVKKILNGGGGLSTELARHASKFFPRAKLLSAYGMTETCSSLTFMILYDPTSETTSQTLETPDERKCDSVQPQGVCVGKPAPHVELKISVERSSRIGRILTRGPHVMLGYWDQSPSKTSDSCNKHWLDTGDIGYVDDYGNVWLIGRTNGRIKSGGENVYPEEVESILSQHPGIMNAVIVGIPDARFTEMVVACIRLRTEWKWSNRSLGHSVVEEKLYLSSDILRQYCIKKSLTGFKIPKIFVLWKKPFPITSTGKNKYFRASLLFKKVTTWSSDMQNEVARSAIVKQSWSST